MKKNHRKTGNKALGTSLVLVYLVLITTSIVSGLMARYTTQSQSLDNARVAAFAFCVMDPAEENAVHFPDLTEIQRPGDQITYIFTVQNYRDSGVASEVDQAYTLTMTENGSLPLTYTLTKKEMTEGVTITADTVTMTATGTEQTVSCGGSFKAGVFQSVTYQLDVEWPFAENSPEYAAGTGVAELQLSVISEQID